MAPGGSSATSDTPAGVRHDSFFDPTSGVRSLGIHACNYAVIEAGRRIFSASGTADTSTGSGHTYSPSA